MRRLGWLVDGGLPPPPPRRGRGVGSALWPGPEGARPGGGSGSGWSRGGASGSAWPVGPRRGRGIGLDEAASDGWGGPHTRHGGAVIGRGSAMPDALSEETSQLLEDYLQHCRPGAPPRPPHGPKACTLRREAASVLAQHQGFLQDSCSQLRDVEPAEILRRVAGQLEAEGGLNWGRVLALIAFAGVLSRGGCAETPRRLAGVLSHYLAQEQRAWLERSGGWDGFNHFFNKSNTHPDDQNCTKYNAIIAAAGVGLAGLAFLLAVR